MGVERGFQFTVGLLLARTSHLVIMRWNPTVLDQVECEVERYNERTGASLWYRVDIAECRIRMGVTLGEAAVYKKVQVTRR